VRQAIILVVGLLLIAVWGVGLRLAIHGSHSNNAPDLVPPNSTAQPLLSSTGTTTGMNLSSHSYVAQASYAPPLGDEPQLVSILDKAAGRGILWNAGQMFKSPVWLRSNEIELTYTFITRPAPQVDPIALKIDAANIGQPVAIDSKLTWLANQLKLTINLASIPSNEFQVVLSAEKNTGPDNYSFKCTLEPAGGGGSKDSQVSAGCSLCSNCSRNTSGSKSFMARRFDRKDNLRRTVYR